jgi:hypothetical protein
MSFRYALSWAGGDHAWHHPLSFSCVVDAKTHAHEPRQSEAANR